MRHPVSRELYAYWDTLRGRRSAPERTAIDPAAIRHLLSYTFLLEVDDQRGARSRAVSFRLSGTRLNALFRRELKGDAFADIWTDEGRGEAMLLVERTLDDATAAIAGVRGGPADYAPVDFELLLLPLRHHGRTHARLLGSLVAELVPSWMGLRPIHGLDVVSFRSLLARDASRLGQFSTAARALETEGVPIVAHPAGPPPTADPQPRAFRVLQGGRSATGAERP